jgi:hypothetical protein
MVLLFVVCGWREEAVAGVFLRTYLVHSTYVLFCTRAKISVFIVKPTVLLTAEILRLQSTKEEVVRYLIAKESASPHCLSNKK